MEPNDWLSAAVAWNKPSSRPPYAVRSKVTAAAPALVPPTTTTETLLAIHMPTRVAGGLTVIRIAAELSMRRTYQRYDLHVAEYGVEHRTRT